MYEKLNRFIKLKANFNDLKNLGSSLPKGTCLVVQLLGRYFYHEVCKTFVVNKLRLIQIIFKINFIGNLSAIN